MPKVKTTLHDDIRNGAKRFLNVDEAAYWLGISPRTIYNELSQGTFPVQPKRWGRKLLWDVRKLNAWADSQEQG